MLGEACKDQGWVLCTTRVFFFYFYKAHENHKMPKGQKKKVKADARSERRYFADIRLYIEWGSGGVGGAGGRQTWLAVAVAKGTLVADVVAADTVAGVAPCIMGTWRKRSHRQSNQIPPKKTTVFSFFLTLVCLLYRMLTKTRIRSILQQSLDEAATRRVVDTTTGIGGNLWSAMELIGKSTEQSVIACGRLLPHAFSSAMQAQE